MWPKNELEARSFAIMMEYLEKYTYNQLFVFISVEKI